MTIQFSKNPGISVRICTDLYRFAGSAQHGNFYHLGVYLKHHKIDVETWSQIPCLSFISIQGRNQGYEYIVASKTIIVIAWKDNKHWTLE